MTNREFYTAVINGEITEEVIKHANEGLEKLDARSTKTQTENAPIKEALLKYLTENEGQFTEVDLGVALNVTHNKAGALARQLVAEGKVVSAEIKIAKVGKRKVYSIAK